MLILFFLCTKDSFSDQVNKCFTGLIFKMFIVPKSSGVNLFGFAQLPEEMLRSCNCIIFNSTGLACLQQLGSCFAPETLNVLCLSLPKYWLHANQCSRYGFRRIHITLALGSGCVNSKGIINNMIYYIIFLDPVHYNSIKEEIIDLFSQKDVNNYKT